MLEIMSIFKNIDELLKIFARKINAKLTIDRPYSLNTFEERRIDWKDNKIDKSILIQPNFERDGVNSKKWNLTLVACSYNDNEDRLQWISYLVEEKKIKVIESDIENLLKISYEKLKNIKIDDLSKPY
jgi:hypothetical protein